MNSSLILCKLCICHSEDLLHLYDKNGQANNYYLLSMKYFGKELEDLGIMELGELHSRVICVNCWNHMNSFNEFQLSIQAAQIDYGYLIKNEINIKSEMERELDLISLDTQLNYALKDPVAPDDPADCKEIQENIRTSPVALKNVKHRKATKKSTQDKESNKSIFREFKECTVKLAPLKEKKLHKMIQVSDSVGLSANTAKKKDRDAFIADHMKNELPCAICSYVCKNMTEIKNHYRQQHNTRGYVQCCSRKFYNRIHLVDHINVHINSEYFKCEQCGKNSASRRSLAAHINNTHCKQTKKFECLNYHRRFMRASCLRVHLETHATGNKDFVCDDCGKGFVLESRLKLHIRNVHAKPYNRVCELCGKAVQGLLGLKKHLLTHKGIPTQRWPCSQCDAQLVSKYSLRRHMLVAHSDGSTVYICSICGKFAKTEDALKGHKRYAHQNKPKFQCNICQKNFKVSLTLREHMTTHTGEELYQCPHCTKTFRSNANMHHHRKRVHPKEWLEKHQQRQQMPKIDMSRVSNEVIL